jgi:hypothetical protein
LDLVLLFLLAFAFAGLLSIMKVSLAWSLFMVMMLAMIYIAIRHPHGRKSWEHDIKASLYFVVTAVLLIMMLYVMYLAQAAMMLPPLVTIVIWLSAGVLGLLALLGLFFPHGYPSAGKASHRK